MRFNIVNLYKQGSPYAACLEDVREPLCHALCALGYAVGTSDNSFAEDARNIIFGLQDLPDMVIGNIPENSIIYNFEQISSGSKAMRPHYLKALKCLEVWEYSKRNLEILRKDFDVQNIKLVPLGFMPQMARINPDYPKDIDVLLYGSTNERRVNIIKRLQDRGITAILADKVFGEDRDFLIARTRLVLNVHYYTPGILEVVRLSYLLANKKTVVSEFNDDTEMMEGYEEACIYAPYDQLADMVQVVLSREQLSKNQAVKGHEVFKRNSYIKILSEVLNPLEQSACGGKVIPKKFNAGSGKDFRLDFLNADISSKWNPDIVLDLSKPLGSEIYESRRFGELALRKGYFEQIVANDLLEHVPDLAQTMTNFLELLCEGGVLCAKVPYDLSLGAWQDPTHLRALNENSWKYYTNWAWYLGWKEWRFDLEKIEYDLSRTGKHYHLQGMQTDELLRIPRAVDSMSVVLRKRKSTPSEILEYDKRHHAFYISAGTELKEKKL